jgi:hypothetical protein
MQRERIPDDASDIDVFGKLDNDVTFDLIGLKKIEMIDSLCC